MNVTDCLVQVSDEGDVLYIFPKDYRSKLAAKSIMMKLEPLLEKGKVWTFVFTLVQVLLYFATARNFSVDRPWLSIQ